MFLRNKIKLNCVVITSLVIFLDQYSKYLVTTNFLDLNNKNLILFNIDIIKNYGAAFNIFSKNTFFLSLFSIFSSIIIILFLVYNNKIIDE